MNLVEIPQRNSLLNLWYGSSWDILAKFIPKIRNKNPVLKGFCFTKKKKSVKQKKRITWLVRKLVLKSSKYFGSGQ